MSDEIAYQAQPHMTPPETWTLTLNRYERDNLLHLLEHVMDDDDRALGRFNTGDWVGEIRWMLGKRTSPGAGPGAQQLFAIDANDHPLPVRPA